MTHCQPITNHPWAYDPSSLAPFQSEINQTVCVFSASHVSLSVSASRAADMLIICGHFLQYVVCKRCEEAWTLRWFTTLCSIQESSVWNTIRLPFSQCVKWTVKQYQVFFRCLLIDQTAKCYDTSQLITGWPLVTWSVERLNHWWCNDV